MRLQATQASCGANSISNACWGLHLDISEGEAVRWINKVKRENAGADGVTEDLLLRAIVEGAPKRLQLHARAMQTSDAGLALAALRGLLEDGAVAILAVDCDSHWVSCYARNGGRFFIADGADSDGRVTIPYTGEELQARWENPIEPAVFFMIAMWTAPWRKSS
jgi:hypothetical protein